MDVVRPILPKAVLVVIGVNTASRIRVRQQLNGFDLSAEVEALVDHERNSPCFLGAVAIGKIAGGHIDIAQHRGTEGEERQDGSLPKNVR